MLKVQLLGGKCPTKAYDSDAGWDVFSNEFVDLRPMQQASIPTGIAVQLPSGTYGRIADKSGRSLQGLDVGAGVIDQSFSGEILVVIRNLSDKDVSILRGDKIAQLIITKIDDSTDIEIVDELDSSDRGSSGFGSSGLV